MHESYPPDWAKVTLVVSPTGEMHAIDGDRAEGDPRDDLPYIGLERIKANSDLHYLDNDSVVTGERAALLLDDERQRHKRTSSELADVVKALTACATEWAAKAEAFRAEQRIADANLADQFTDSIRAALKRATALG